MARASRRTTAKAGPAHCVGCLAPIPSSTGTILLELPPARTQLKWRNPSRTSASVRRGLFQPAARKLTCYACARTAKARLPHDFLHHRGLAEDRWKFGEIIHLPGHGPLEFARAFKEARKPGQIVLSLDRVPGWRCLPRRRDGVHAAWLARRRQAKQAGKANLAGVQPKHFALMNLERQVYRSVRMVVANSQMVAEEIRHWHDFPEDRIRIVPNGIGGGHSHDFARSARAAGCSAGCVLRAVRRNRLGARDCASRSGGGTHEKYHAAGGRAGPGEALSFLVGRILQGR